MFNDIENPKPERRATIEIHGRNWDLVKVGKFTWPEAKLVKQMCGMGLVQLEQGLEVADPEAWFTYLYVCIKRQWPALTPGELEAAIGATPLVEVMESVQEAAPEVASDDPPAPALTNDEHGAMSAGGSGS